MTDMRCPCGSCSQFKECCEPYIQGTDTAPHAEALMRSRYSAYVTQQVEYLLNTWHASARTAELRQLLMNDGDETQWLGLTVLSSEAGQSDNEAFVTFFARYQCEQEKGWIYEKSRFLKEGNCWYYIDGTHFTPGRNETCPCGSGKKFKRCCAK